MCLATIATKMIMSTFGGVWIKWALTKMRLILTQIDKNRGLNDVNVPYSAMEIYRRIILQQIIWKMVTISASTNYGPAPSTGVPGRGATSTARGSKARPGRLRPYKLLQPDIKLYQVMVWCKNKHAAVSRSTSIYIETRILSGHLQ